MAMLTGGQRAVTMTAVTDSELWELKQDAFQRLLFSVPGLAANVCRTLGYRLRRETTGRSARSPTQVVGLVNTTPRTRDLWPRLAKALAADGDSLVVLTEHALPQAADVPYFVEKIPPPSPDSDRAAWVQQRLARVPQRGHVLLNVAAEASSNDLARVTSQCEQIWWLVEPASAETAIERLQGLVAAQPRLASRIHIVWILREHDSSIPFSTPTLAIARPDFKVVLDNRRDNPSRDQRRGVSRLVRQIHGTRVGLALGGGGARGLAHLGVLRALEREEIYFDLIAGTSIGALMALPYACGWDLDHAIAAFRHDLTPGWFFRRLPQGKHWFMLFNFRTRGWESMLRRHFGDVRLEQLSIPLSTVAVDLVS
ncbi:MAG: patatin-like phospholipase family protein, partial [Planctomycetia bacterium]|nr:patatin-like phospholipase family protein [Planctomycetia bacterium]